MFFAGEAMGIDFFRLVKQTSFRFLTSPHGLRVPGRSHEDPDFTPEPDEWWPHGGIPSLSAGRGKKGWHPMDFWEMKPTNPR